MSLLVVIHFLNINNNPDKTVVNLFSKIPNYNLWSLITPCLAFYDNDNFFHFFTIFLSISQKSHLQIFIEFLSQLVTLVFVEWAPALNDNCPCFRWQLPLLRTCSLEVPLKESTCWSKGRRPLRPLSSFGLGKSSPEIRYSLFYQNLGSYCSHIVK